MKELSDREMFVETWLSEMPMGTPSTELYGQLIMIIMDWKNTGLAIVKHEKNMYSIKGASTALYWIEDNDGVITLGTELKIKPQAFVVSFTAKNPSYKGKPPYASDLYGFILADSEMSLRIMSDEVLSDEGYAIWKKLLSQGHKVSVYDSEAPGHSFKTFESPIEMDEFFKHGDRAYSRYQYVLSEGKMYPDTMGHFGTRRMREHAGIL